MDLVEKWLQEAPESSEAHMANGDVLLELKKYSEAEAALIKALDLSPNNLRAQDLLSRVARQQIVDSKSGQRTFAKLKSWITFPRYHARFLCVLGDLEQGEGRVHGARSLFQEAHDKDPTYHKPPYELAILFASAGESEKAQKWLQRSFSWTQDCAVCYEEYLLRLQEQERYEELLVEAEKFLGFYPFGVSRLVWRLRALTQLGDIKKVF